MTGDYSVEKILTTPIVSPVGIVLAEIIGVVGLALWLGTGPAIEAAILRSRKMAVAVFRIAHTLDRKFAGLDERFEALETRIRELENCCGNYSNRRPSMPRQEFPHFTNDAPADSRLARCGTASGVQGG